MTERKLFFWQICMTVLEKNSLRGEHIILTLFTNTNFLATIKINYTVLKNQCALYIFIILYAFYNYGILVVTFIYTVHRWWRVKLIVSAHFQRLSGVLYMRQCEIKDIKLYQARTKLIALGWYRVIMIFLAK